jgi:hypothetical protein
MTCSWRWFIHPETAISKNRNGSSTLGVFKTHYRDRRAALAKYRVFMQIQFRTIRGRFTGRLRFDSDPNISGMHERTCGNPDG